MNDAITAANAPGPDTITFDVDGTIFLTSSLPQLTDPDTTIDGTGRDITIDGSALGVSNAFNVRTSSATFRKLRIENFLSSGISVTSASVTSLTLDGVVITSLPDSTALFVASPDVSNVTIKDSTLEGGAIGNGIGFCLPSCLSATGSSSISQLEVTNSTLVGDSAISFFRRGAPGDSISISDISISDSQLIGVEFAAISIGSFTENPDDPRDDGMEPISIALSGLHITRSSIDSFTSCVNIATLNHSDPDVDRNTLDVTGVSISETDCVSGTTAGIFIGGGSPAESAAVLTIDDVSYEGGSIESETFGFQTFGTADGSSQSNIRIANNASIVATTRGAIVLSVSGESDGITIEDNGVISGNSGISIGGPSSYFSSERVANVSIRGNDTIEGTGLITTNFRSGIGILSEDNESIVISDNGTISGSSVVVQVGPQFGPPSPAGVSRNRDVEVRNNGAILSGGGVAVQVGAINTLEVENTNVLIEANTIVGADSTAGSVPAMLVGSQALGTQNNNVVIKSNDISNLGGGPGISLRALGGGTGVVVTANVIHNNGSSGIGIRGSHNTIGGLVPADANTITGNGGAGVAVIEGLGNRVYGNSIFDNGGLGIDIGTLGVTANDAGDADTGANQLQNFPTLTSATSTVLALQVQGSISSNASTAIRIEFFASPSCDSLGNGEGKTRVGATDVVTNGSGIASIVAALTTSVAPGQVITATATSAAGNTSEFSGCMTVVAGTPMTADDCKKNGWKAFLAPSGTPAFKNQGDCVSWVQTGGKNPPSGS